MLKMDIPGYGELHLSDAVFDFNGTLAVEGELIDGIAERLNILAERMHLHIITGDSFGKAKSELADIKCKLTILKPENQAIAKRNYLKTVDPKHTVAIGNGRNDQYMLKEAALGIVVSGREGAAIETILAANILMPDIESVLDTLLHQKRLIATLRS
ncbi:MAG: ATPase P [Gammaproteobacteria bacterium]|nr:ATPase P [Gammaproteobacteria bacterium]MCW5583926.1 ATPase P [Gammaproteobacteria bacterium]